MASGPELCRWNAAHPPPPVAQVVGGHLWVSVSGGFGLSLTRVHKQVASDHFTMCVLFATHSSLCAPRPVPRVPAALWSAAPPPPFLRPSSSPDCVGGWPELRKSSSNPCLPQAHLLHVGGRGVRAVSARESQGGDSVASAALAVSACVCPGPCSWSGLPIAFILKTFFESFKFLTKVIERYRDFSYTADRTASPADVFSTFPPAGTLVTKDEPALTCHRCPKFVVYLSIHSRFLCLLKIHFLCQWVNWSSLNSSAECFSQNH